MSTSAAAEASFYAITTITVPDGVEKGQTIRFENIDGEVHEVQCPDDLPPDRKIHLKGQSYVHAPNKTVTIPSFAVPVPVGCLPGTKFKGEVDGQIIEVTCPANKRPGDQFLVVENALTLDLPSLVVPAKPEKSKVPTTTVEENCLPTLVSLPETKHVHPFRTESNIYVLHFNSPEHGHVQGNFTDASGEAVDWAPAYDVTVPEGAEKGKEFRINLRGHSFTALCPTDEGPGYPFKFIVGEMLPNMNPCAVAAIATEHVQAFIDDKGN